MDQRAGDARQQGCGQRQAFVGVLGLEVAGVVVDRRFRLAGRRLRQLLDEFPQLVVLDDDRIDRCLRPELDSVDRLQVGRVRQQHGQPVASLGNRHDSGFSQQLRVDQVGHQHAGIERREVRQRQTEGVRREARECYRVHLPAGDELVDEPALRGGGLLLDGRGLFSADHLVLDQRAGKAGKQRCGQRQAFVGVLGLEVAGVVVDRRFRLAGRRLRQLLDEFPQLVVLDDDRIDRCLRPELDSVDRLQVGRVRQQHGQPVASLGNRHDEGLGQQLRVDQVGQQHAGIERREVHQRQTEGVSGKARQIERRQTVAAHQHVNELCLGGVGFLLNVGCFFRRQHLVLHQRACHPRQHDVVGGGTCYGEAHRLLHIAERFFIRLVCSRRNASDTAARHGKDERTVSACRRFAAVGASRRWPAGRPPESVVPGET